MRSILLVILITGSLFGCGYQHRSISYDRPVGAELGPFDPGTTSVDDVLAAYGPPAELAAAGEGFSFRYLHVEEDEFSFRIAPFVVTRLGVFGGVGDEAARVLVFDADGVLRHERSESYPSGGGIGVLGGVIGTPQPPFWRILFHDETAEMHGPPPLWGATLLRTAPTSPPLPEY
jgi:hypothetical protein